VVRDYYRIWRSQAAGLAGFRALECRLRAELFQRPSFQAGQEQMTDWIVSGANELYTIEQE
jgi:hypothetical protein